MQKDKKEVSKVVSKQLFSKPKSKGIRPLLISSDFRHLNKIVLLGYMASGKTSVGRELADDLNRSFIDLDAYIAKKENLSISELFSKKGETFFREKEFKYLKEILNREDSCVLALGGGTPLIKGTMKLINAKSFSIYLKASTNTLYNRLRPETVERPLLTNIPKGFLQEYIQEHVTRREKYYKKADLSIAVDNLSISEIILLIKNTIRD